MTLQTIFLTAIDIPDLADRRAFLDRACQDNPQLRSKVDALLEAHDQSPKTSKPKVHLAQGPAQGFTEEISSLLRQRLLRVSAVWVAVLAFTFLTTVSMPGLWLRLLIVFAAVACFLLLRSSRPFSLRQLRAMEIAILLVTCIQMMYMPSVLILERAEAGDFATAIMDKYFNLGAWAVVILGYGLLIPNTWKRAFLVLVPVAIAPYLHFWLLGHFYPKVGEAFASIKHGPPMPLPLVALFIAVYCVHALHAIRAEAYKARKFGQYQLLERLGQGGMGEVYKAEHLLLKRPCAIKLIRPGIDADAKAIAYFEREVKETARLSHWNTVEIYDYGRTDDGIFYYVMELLPGLNLSELVERYGPVPPERAIHLLRQVCAGLREAHGLGLIHRDIKPANLIASQRGGVDDIVKILDFGLVKSIAPGQGAEEVGVIAGSPPYFSPEQASAIERLDGRCDLYSLGAVAYWLVTGKPPFSKNNAVDYIVAHTTEPIVPPSKWRPSLPADLEAVILRCLEKNRDDRYADAAALDQALAKCHVPSPWNADRAAEWWRRHGRRSDTSRSVPIAEAPPILSIQVQAPSSELTETLPIRSAR